MTGQSISGPASASRSSQCTACGSVVVMSASGLSVITTHVFTFGVCGASASATGSSDSSMRTTDASLCPVT